ncbi:MAG: M23 family metallopeptidase [Comamonadaceae bacterium]|uniref:M23 family metallopeptidase n=1 Tax=Candidatus Skiveiella danica TaxID=3386177 RepID=UPI0039097580|nr:M23 family metallopeptidase [Comamonadaceae bacterium]
MPNPGTPITAARSGRVKRVVDGRGSNREAARRAGLWVDVEVGKQMDRYLHLGEAKVVPGQKIKRGDLIGVVAEAKTSGTGKGPHLHFEVRAGDYTSERQDYGAPINPKFEVV